jgi:hypothetical protein
MPVVHAELVRQGSSLRVELWQYCQWYHALLRSEQRTCELDATDTAAFCEEAEGEIGYVRFPDLAAMVRAARRWLEDSASLDDMRAEVATWEPSRRVQLARRREERGRARDRQDSPTGDGR